MVGVYETLVAEVVDINGDGVGVHCTYLEQGWKVRNITPRKQFGRLEGRRGCAVRLMPATGVVLGIAEGIETALSASIILGIPVWAATNAALLGRFEPPLHVNRLVICGDRDKSGHTAASKLSAALKGRLRCEVVLPTAPYKDFNDQLVAVIPSDGPGPRQQHTDYER